MTAMTMALTGIAVYYGKTIFNHHGENKMVLAGAFSKTLYTKSPVSLLLNHQDEYLVGRNILELYSNDEALFFRARLPDTAFGRCARDMAVNLKCSGISIGFDYQGAKKEARMIDGVEVTCVVEASLYEISFVEQHLSPAMKQAFAVYRDVDYSESLEQQRMALLCDGAAIGFKQSLQKLMNT
jgi:HK97 family phage prohead protease